MPPGKPLCKGKLPLITQRVWITAIWWRQGEISNSLTNASPHVLWQVIMMNCTYSNYALRKSESEVKVLVAQLCLILCDPMDCSPPGFSVHGILQARILEWIAIPFSRGLPHPGIKTWSPAFQADSLPSEPLGKPWWRQSKSNLEEEGLDYSRQTDLDQLRYWPWWENCRISGREER